VDDGTDVVVAGVAASSDAQPARAITMARLAAPAHPRECSIRHQVTEMNSAILGSLIGMETKNLAEADGLPALDWSQVEHQLTDLLTHDDPRSPNRSTFWLTTLNADGSAHVTSVGALWHAGSVWFQTGQRTRKAKNVARDPRCTVSVATGNFDVMVAGEARRVTDPKIVAEIAALWAKSGWPAEPDESGSGITAPFNAPTLGPPPWFVYELKPRTATAVGTAEETPGSTRWTF